MWQIAKHSTELCDEVVGFRLVQWFSRAKEERAVSLSASGCNLQDCLFCLPHNTSELLILMKNRSESLHSTRVLPLARDIFKEDRQRKVAELRVDLGESEAAPTTLIIRLLYGSYGNKPFVKDDQNIVVEVAELECHTAISCTIAPEGGMLMKVAIELMVKSRALR